MIPTQTIPSLSGTFGIPARLASIQKCQKSLQAHPAPTHELSDSALIMRQIDKEIIKASVQHRI